MSTETTFQDTFKNADEVKIEIYKNDSSVPVFTLDNSKRQWQNQFAKNQNFQLKIIPSNQKILPNFYVKFSSFFKGFVEFDPKSLGPYHNTDTEFYFISPLAAPYCIKINFPMDNPSDPPATNVTVGDDEPSPG